MDNTNQRFEQHSPGKYISTKLKITSQLLSKYTFLQWVWNNTHFKQSVWPLSQDIYNCLTLFYKLYVKTKLSDNSALAWLYLMTFSSVAIISNLLVNKHIDVNFVIDLDQLLMLYNGNVPWDKEPVDGEFPFAKVLMSHFFSTGKNAIEC